MCNRLDSIPSDASRIPCNVASSVRVCVECAVMSEHKRKKKHFQASSGQLHVSGAGSRPHGDKGPNPCKVFVANISYKVSTTVHLLTGRPIRFSPCFYAAGPPVLIGIQVSEREMKEFFAYFGAVKYCQIVKDHQKRRSRG